MHDDVAHPNDVRPGNIRMIFLKSLRHSAGGFAQNLKISEHSVLCQRVLKKPLLPFSGVRKYAFYRLFDVAEIDVILLHNGVAVLRISFFSMGFIAVSRTRSTGHCKYSSKSRLSRM